MQFRILRRLNQRLEVAGFEASWQDPGTGPLRFNRDPLDAQKVEVMAIPELERERAARALRRFCEKVPVEIRHQLTHDFRFVRSDIYLLERRPYFQNRKRRVEHVVAKFRYNARRGCWSLLWSDRNLRWHTYDGFEEKRDFLDLLREVERDPTGIFFG